MSQLLEIAKEEMADDGQSTWCDASRYSIRSRHVESFMDIKSQEKMSPIRVIRWGNTSKCGFLKLSKSVIFCWNMQINIHSEQDDVLPFCYRSRKIRAKLAHTIQWCLLGKILLKAHSTLRSQTVWGKYFWSNTDLHELTSNFHV